MDQLKEILKQAIKYRFWIAVGISALLPMIAYAVGSDPIKKKAESETKSIKDAEKGVKQYSSGVIPNDQYKPLVEKEKNVLSDDVNASWKKLYKQQEPLLTWPETVEQRFRTWGRTWPEKEDPSTVQVAIIDYVTAYPKYVTEVYKTFRPFDPIEGTGVVAAPPEAALLKPAPFTTEKMDLPSLGKVWAAQERLWIQRTLLQVIADVNKNAKDWDSAIIRQINTLEVGNSAAQDQISIGKGEPLEEAPELTAPGAEAAAPTTESTGSPMESMMRGMGNMGGAPAGKTENVYYIKTESTQYKILPVQLSVLVEQDRIPDVLIALENSPMAIQVVEFEMSKPAARVSKPKKGDTMDYGMGMMGMMGGMRGRMMMGQMRGGSMAGFGWAMSRMMMNPMMAGGRMGFGAAAEQRKGVDKRTVDRGKKKEEEIKALDKVVTQTIHDPYYYLVELSVYGQARFYNPPPVEPAPEPSQAEGAPTTDAEAKKAEGEPAKTEGEPAKAEGEPAKTEAESAKKAEADADKAKAEPAKKAEGEPAKKAEGEPAKKAEGEPAKKAEGEAPKAKDDASQKTEPAKDAPADSTPKK